MWCINKSAINNLDKLIKKAGWVVEALLDTLEIVAGKKTTLNKLLAIMGNASHPLHYTVGKQKRTFRPERQKRLELNRMNKTSIG